MADIRHHQKKTGEFFAESFGSTPLAARLEDIFGEAIELRRFTTVQNLRDEYGDLLASLLALGHECGFDPVDALAACHKKITDRRVQYRSLGRKLNIALLGGAFDPPTVGHVAVAKAILDWSKTFDEVWFVPCFRHMFNKKMTKTEYRIEMCKLAVADDPRIRVWDYEVEHKLRGTYHFAKTIQDDPECENFNFSIIIGMDNANTFDKWFNYGYLERMIRFVVVDRAGETSDPAVDWYRKPPHIYFRCEQPLPEVSSTMARERFRRWFNNDHDIEYDTYRTEQHVIEVMGVDVFKYALEHHLYREKIKE